MTKMKTNPFFAYERTSLEPVLPALHETPVAIDVLIDILGYRRDGGSRGEAAMIDKYLMPLGPEQDHYGNLFVTLPDADGNAPTVAFTAHTDSVHRDFEPTAKSPGMMDERQTVVLSHGGLIASVEDNQCLGADDGTGVWILLNLIEASVPGLYCFFRDEERGRLGSEWSAKYQAARYDDIRIMLSFDRAGTTDIITHQMGQRCCSETFAERLGLAIDPSGELVPDDTGSYTDSYSFLDMIPECTNVSVGYEAQHTRHEQQDLSWASFLVERLITLDYAALPVERDPAEPDEPIELADLLETLPLDVAEVLEECYGITVKDLLRDMAEYYGYKPADFAARVGYLRDGSSIFNSNYSSYYDDHYNFEAMRDDATHFDA